MNIGKEIEKLNKRLDAHTELFLDIQYAITHKEKYSQPLEDVIAELINKQLVIK